MTVKGFGMQEFRVGAVPFTQPNHHLPGWPRIIFELLPVG